MMQAPDIGVAVIFGASTTIVSTLLKVLAGDEWSSRI
jgi:hypothetical protein